MGHLIEVFITGCPLCQEAIEVVEKAMCPECRLVVYNVYENPQYVEKAREYSIRALPAIVIDKEKKFEGVPRLDEIKQVLQ